MRHLTTLTILSWAIPASILVLQMRDDAWAMGIVLAMAVLTQVIAFWSTRNHAPPIETICMLENVP